MTKRTSARSVREETESRKTKLNTTSARHLLDRSTHSSTPGQMARRRHRHVHRKRRRRR
jgi:hypothetical protein